MPFVPLHRPALRLGLFIKIEGSWFSHPFPTNSFKIKTIQELEILQGLTTVTLHVDPDRSDPEVGQSESRESGSTEMDQEVSGPDGRLQDACARETPSKSEKNEMGEDSIQRKQAQHQAFYDYQEDLQQVETQFHEVVQEAKHIMQDVVSGRPRGLRTARKIVGHLYDMLGEAEHSRALLNLIGSHESHEEFFLHALNVCSLSLMVAQDLGFNREDTEVLALGALFHDVGELKFPAEQLLRKGFMSPSELRHFMQSHPRYGVETVQKLPNFPYEAIEIIRRHHEGLHGSGAFPGKKELSISTLAKIVMVVDEYDELCHHPDPSKALIPAEALSSLYVKCRHTPWSDVIVSLIKQLGVYPPGSLVRLSNQTIGMVTSVNLANRLRPVILVYDDCGPSEDPIVLNLDEESDALVILHALHPTDLSPKIRECLKVRRMISYFPSVSSSSAESGNEAVNTMTSPS